MSFVTSFNHSSFAINKLWLQWAAAMSKLVLPLHSACTIVAENLTFFIMIDTTQLTQLISAFRVETEKESISPETVGSLLQNITDLLANASSTTEQQIF